MIDESKMKAVLYYKYGPPEVLQHEEVKKPIPKANEILLKIRASAVTMGDCEMRSPKIPNLTWFLARLYFGLRKPRQRILGSYVAGEKQYGMIVSLLTGAVGERQYGMIASMSNGVYKAIPVEFDIKETLFLGSKARILDVTGIDNLPFDEVGGEIS